MGKKVFACVLLFLVILCAHAAWRSTRLVGAEPTCGSSCGPAEAASSQPGEQASEGGCCPSETALQPMGLSGYLEGQDYFLGLSYSLSGAFALYALWVFLERRRAAAAAAAAGGGIAVAGAASVLGCGACFLGGCCGSPTLPILASFLGGAFLGFVKPLAFGVTVISVGFGLWWLSRKQKAATATCGCDDTCCGG